MLDRKTPPAPTSSEKTTWIEAQEHALANGSKLFSINAGEQEVIRFEIIFPYTTSDIKSYRVASSSHSLTDSGTTTLDSKSIAEAFDRLGSYYQADSGYDHRTYTIFSLRSSFEKTLKILRELLENANFPEHEVEIWKKRNKEQLRISREKVSWLTRTTFVNELFGKAHPYGFVPLEEDYESIQADELRTFHRDFLQKQEPLFVISGKLGKSEIDLVNREFGNNPTTSGFKDFKPTAPSEALNNKIRVEKKDASQCSIRIGRQMFAKNHPDYIPFQITNTVLGGYFGSRLMSNIREDKGYTYGIGSVMVPFSSSGMFFISTEVGKDVCDAAVGEIYNELSRLSNDPPNQEELQVVKNYLLGEFQRSLDGPFALADRFKSLHLHGLEYDYLNKYLDILNSFSSKQLVEMASKYFNSNEFVEVIAG